MSNPVRPCPACQVFDDHPRHVVALDSGEDLALHMDCCAERGCKICAHQLALVAHAPGVVGDELRNRLVLLPAQAVEHADHNPYGAVTVSVA